MKFGLIGHPIEHSLSPALFKAGYDGSYPYELIETPDFEQAYARFLGEYDGINITAPFKELALRKADIISDECRMIGATNLLVKTSEGVKAYNSDYLGVKLWLSEISKGRDRLPKVLIVGMGGAGKAAAAAAKSSGYETVLINRTQYSPEIQPLNDFCNEFRKADIIIYNLPVRIPQIDMLSEEDLSAGNGKTILEANYRHPEFHLEHKNIRYVDGREWLLLQAVTGYEIFTGKTPDYDAMKAVIKSK
jgi:shikimate dehydrogenase